MPTLHLLIFKIITVMGKIIKFLLICLGFKSLTACEVFYGTDEYGTPYAEYEAKGRVSDSEGTPISGIKVSMGVEDYMDSVAVTDADGRFHVIHDTFPLDDNTFDIQFQFTDIDGEAGGGLFEEQTVTVQAEKVEEGEGWSRGKYAVKEDVNVVLERQ